MIGSHNSYTFLPATSKFMELFSKWWRAQSTTIDVQYEQGVRFFDVRVCRGGRFWRAAHGGAKLKKRWVSLSGVLYEIGSFPGAKARIVLESGGEDDVKEFKRQVDLYRDTDIFKDVVDGVYIKNPWTTVIPGKLTINEFNFEHWSAKNIIKNIFNGSPIKDWAKASNPLVTKQMISDPDTVYMMDYASESIRCWK